MATLDDDVRFAGEYLDFAEMSRDELQSKLFEYAVEQGIIRPPETGKGPAADLEAYRKLKGRS